MGRTAFRLVNSYSYQDILAAYFSCRERKRTTHSALQFELGFELYLQQLLDEINNKTYRIGRSRVFTVTWPKPREIWAALFRDRIVHHLVCNDVAPYFEARFIPDSFACIKGRGTLAAANRAGHFFRSATDNWHHQAYSLQIDIRNFFVSINRVILWQKLSRVIGEDSLTSYLWKLIIFNDPTRNPIIKRGTNFDIIPKHKSLWHAPPMCGLPIGNLTSQFLANLYLDDFDHFVKHGLKCHYYARYVDDAVLLSQSRTQLEDWQVAIDNFLRRDVKLQLHPDKVFIRPALDGITFVGHTIRPYHIGLRSMTWNSALQIARALRENVFDRNLVCSLNSYLGMAQHHNCYNRRRELCEMVCVPGILESDAGFNKIFYLLDF
jgi:retron-type reverse transcriptase